MLGRLRSLFRAVTRLGSCPAGWPPFRPSLECLGDRALPSAGHAAAAGGAAHPGHEAAHAAPDHPEAEKSSAHAPPHAADENPASGPHRHNPTEGPTAHGNPHPGHERAAAGAADDDPGKPTKSRANPHDDHDDTPTATAHPDRHRPDRGKDSGAEADSADPGTPDPAEDSPARVRAAGRSSRAAAGEAFTGADRLPAETVVLDDLGERVLRLHVEADRLLAEGVAVRPTGSPDVAFEDRVDFAAHEEPIPLTRVERREVIADLLLARVAYHSERYLSPPDTGEASGEAASAARAGTTTPPESAGSGPVPGRAPAPSAAPGDTRAAPPGATDVPNWPLAQGPAAPGPVPAPAVGVVGRTDAGPAVVPLPPTGPVAGDAVPPEPEAPGPAEAAGLISRFLPFDTAGLQAEVGEFLRAVEPVIPAIAERLTPLGWGLAAAALAAGAGVLLRPGRSLLRWRPWALVWPAAGRRPAGPGGASACPGRPGGAPAGCG